MLARVLVPTMLRAFPAPELSDHDIDGVANTILVEYNEIANRGRQMMGSCQPRVVAAGFAKDAIKCYLQRMTLKQTVNWLKLNRHFDCSKTAIGRFWVQLHNIETARIYRKLPR